MEDFKDYFRDKKVTAMGLGLLGRGVGDAEFLAECGADLIVTDLKSETDLEQSVERLRRYKNVTFVLGEHREADFANRDMILVAAGVPLASPFLDHARKAGVPLEQSAALFARLAKIPIIGVTGTRGKSTVTAMIHHILSVTTGEHIIKGGNVRGVSNLQLLKEVKEDSIAVMELDSWQLQGWGWNEMSPQIAVFTSFMEDHLNYYQQAGVSTEAAMKAYFADKANIFTYQDESGVLITTPGVFEQAKRYSATSLGQEVVLVDSSIIPEDGLLAMPGEHNRLNAALAYEALKAVSLTDEEIMDGLASFPGVEGRLQLVRELDHVRIYNDNNATAPQATVVALESLDLGNLPAPSGARQAGKNIVLITGGTDKGIDLGKLPEAIATHCAHTILYSGTGTERLKAELSPEVTTEEHDTLQACVEAALATATRGDIILFSPAFASFGKEFKNEYDRNDQFVQLVMNYGDK